MWSGVLLFLVRVPVMWGEVSPGSLVDLLLPDTRQRLYQHFLALTQMEGRLSEELGEEQQAKAKEACLHYNRGKACSVAPIAPGPLETWFRVSVPLSSTPRLLYLPLAASYESHLLVNTGHLHGQVGSLHLTSITLRHLLTYHEVLWSSTNNNLNSPLPILGRGVWVEVSPATTTTASTLHLYLKLISTTCPARTHWGLDCNRRCECSQDTCLRLSGRCMCSLHGCSYPCRLGPGCHDNSRSSHVVCRDAEGEGVAWPCQCGDKTRRRMFGEACVSFCSLVCHDSDIYENAALEEGGGGGGGGSGGGGGEENEVAMQSTTWLRHCQLALMAFILLFLALYILSLMPNLEDLSVSVYADLEEKATRVRDGGTCDRGAQTT